MREEDFLDKPLPSNEDGEQVILTEIMTWGGTGEASDLAFRSLVPSDFYNPIHRTVFNVMKEMHEQGTKIDPITIIEHYKAQGFRPETIGGVAGVMTIMHGIPRVIHIEEYVTSVKKHSVARQAIRLAHTFSEDLLQGRDEVEDILEYVENQLLGLSNRVHSDSLAEADRGFSDLADIVPDLEQQFHDYHDGKSNGAPTGMKELDELLDGGGLQPGGVYLIGASEKAGKTSLALDWASYAAVKLDLTVPIVTLEMSKLNMAKRLYSAHTGIPYYRFRPGLYDTGTDDTYTRAVEGLKEFAKYPIKIADQLYGMAEIARNLRRVCEQAQKIGKPVKYAIIDYLQLIEPEGTGKNVNREQEVSKISRALKKLATELGIALVVMSSFNRENLKEGQEPTPFNLRESGALAFDAEAVILLHNPAYVPGKPYEPTPITDMVMILARQRNGPTGRIPMKFIGAYMQFMTESQFRVMSQNGNIPVPQSMGQAYTEEETHDKLWDTPPTTAKDHTGEDDVDW